ncbi:MAG TPA: endonuclease/exonuclease/phosphatase family protein [Pilimelia sp.]|nr:endonuclease/exonuclease/phosphatase family protein [Pilimelia sp.]
MSDAVDRQAWRVLGWRVRPALGITLWLLWLAPAAWTVGRITGREGGGALLPVQLLAFTPYVAVASVPLLAAALLARRWWLAAAATAAVALLAACVLPRALPDANPAGGGPRLRVLTVNMLVGGADATTIVDLVRAQRVDLLAVQELTTGGGQALDAAGLAGALPHRVVYLEPHVTGLFSRFPLHDGAVRVLGSAFGQAMATVTVPGAAPITVESVHACAPVGAGDRWWAEDLAAQPPATVDGPVRLLLGDFNATLDHAPLRRLLATGYRDAGDVRGGGLAPTWPNDGRPVPGVTIDHVLADRRVGVVDYRVHAIPRTDHRAVYAELVLPAAPTTVAYPSRRVISS